MYILIGSMKYLKSLKYLIFVVLISSCFVDKPTQNEKQIEISDEQEEMIQKGWSFKTPKGGELGYQYGTNPKYGIQDNYFDIRIGGGFSVALKIVDVASDKCIRYVYVPENQTVTINQIPQGRYYLKLAYGKDWMECLDGNIIQCKFTRSPFYEKSTTYFDFGRKNSQSFVNYTLEINVLDGDVDNNFETINISEEEFNLN